MTAKTGPTGNGPILQSPFPALILCGLRYYDPANGIWLTRDPTLWDGGINLYEYCGDDPVNMVDPDGTQALGQKAAQAAAEEEARAAIAAARAAAATEGETAATEAVGETAAGELAVDAIPGIGEAAAAAEGVVWVAKAGCHIYEAHLTAEQAVLAEPELAYYRARAKDLQHYHHLLPQRFRAWFGRRGIADIDAYCVRIPATTHQRAIHGTLGKHGCLAFPEEDWNEAWGTFIGAHEVATKAMILNRMRAMMRDYHIWTRAIVRYPRKLR